MKIYARHIAYLLKVHIAALLIMTVLRWLLYLTIDYQIADDVTFPTRMMAFVKGVWFDNVTACYVMALPLLTLWIASLFSYSAKWLSWFCTIWFGILYTIVFSLSAANIPYFCYFFQPINTSIFQWFGYAGTTAGMVVGESSYWAPIVYGLTAIVGFWWFLIRWRIKKYAKLKRQGLGTVLVVLISGAIMAGLCFLGIRGRLGYNPIKVSQAYYCNDSFLNQLGINPAFNLLTSYIDDQRPENRRLALMDDKEAIEAVRKLLEREGVEGISPIAQKVEGDAEAQLRGRNVVIVLMESMSSNLMGKGQTPFLDSLSRQSLYFENMYSAGNHTNHGMYATLYSWPAIMFRNLMKGTVIPHYSGLPTVLHDQGYKNYFFMTHESQYDNMNGFFRTNGFDEIYAQENYPSEKIVNSFGVQDDFLYSYAVEKLNKEKKPFFAVLLSVSNHPPFVIPDYFKPKSSEKDQQIVEYADWSIRKLFDEAKKERWFDNTIFVLLGDHGKLMDNPECELPESYNHIPLIIYGKGIKPQTYQDFALQEDVAPTLLGMMGIGYIQNDFGIDLMKKRRGCVFYTGDNLIAARDRERLYLFSPTEKTEHLYMVKGRNKVEKATAKDADFERLKNYVFSMIQTAEVLVGEKKTVTKK
jgi:phosphoglycerol transferase MdoB-like AlkP superfamily enzyme